MNHSAMSTVDEISQRLSLREPQRAAFSVVADAIDHLPATKGVPSPLFASWLLAHGNIGQDHNFPSLCTALATGVGKTRLIGAVMAALRRSGRSRNFLVVAPNLTIYDKLVRDFRGAGAGNVLAGLAEFSGVLAPTVVCGDEYQFWTPRGAPQGSLLPGGEVTIFVLNIGKLVDEAELRQVYETRETLGASFFDYLRALPDLVIFLDEAHRYRTSDAVRTLNALSPLFGVELTATPTGGAGRRPFTNVAYRYPLGAAIRDGFVKQPFVATREDFDPTQYSADALERVKLDDALFLHERTASALTAYAAERNVPAVKPFMLVVATDISHATRLAKALSSLSYAAGRYAGKVQLVHSTLDPSDRDAAIRAILSIEQPSDPTEIVVHVGMLGEGWDVRNLYTIVPLRPAKSRILVEQSIGRGLRLPYGARTGSPDVDRLTIVAHDRYQDIVDEAKRPGSLLCGVVDVGRMKRLPPPVTRSIRSAAAQMVADGTSMALPDAPPALREALTDALLSVAVPAVRGPLSQGEAAARQTVIRRVQAIAADAQFDLLPETAEALVATAGEALLLRTINLPMVSVRPSGEGYLFDRFTLDCAALAPLVDRQRILLQDVTSPDGQVRLERGFHGSEVDPVGALVECLLDRDEVPAEGAADVVVDIAQQAIAYLAKASLSMEGAREIVDARTSDLAQILVTQMLLHTSRRGSSLETVVTASYSRPRDVVHVCDTEMVSRPVHEPAEPLSATVATLFTGCARATHPVQRFDSDPERRLACLLETAEDVLLWLRPAVQDLAIEYMVAGVVRHYQPDFVVELVSEKLLWEVKADDRLGDVDVAEKAAAAAAWCAAATMFEAGVGGKPWRCALTPSSDIHTNARLSTLVSGGVALSRRVALRQLVGSPQPAPLSP